jgi:hypothetical protein
MWSEWHQSCCHRGFSGTTQGLHTISTPIVKTLDPEEQIRSRLREIAKDTRRARQELDEIIWKSPERTRIFSDRSLKLRQKKQEK